MPRKAREYEGKGYYHVMVEGRNHEKLFEENDVKRLYWHYFYRFAKRFSVKIYAYCFLENSVHFVVEDMEGKLCSSVRITHSMFSKDMNMRYPLHRKNSWFRDRFSTLRLETELDLIRAVRYVHQKPELSGLCPDMTDYRWSSFHLYLLKKNPLVETEKVLDALYFSGGYRNFMEQKEISPDLFLNEKPAVYAKGDPEVKKIIGSYAGEHGYSDFVRMTVEEQKDILRLIRRKERISINQLSRVTGFSRGILQRL